MSLQQARVLPAAASPEAVAVGPLCVWTTPEGYAVAQRLPDGELAVLAATTDLTDASDVPAGTACRRLQGAGLLALVPPGYGLLVDGATPGRTLVPAVALDAHRGGPPPRGAEADLRTGPLPDALPPEVHAAAAAAVHAALDAGAAAARALWAVGGGRAGLWLLVSEGADEAVQAAYAVLAGAGLGVPVLVAVDEDGDGRPAPEPEPAAVAAADARVARRVLLAVVPAAVLLVLGRGYPAVQAVAVAVLVAVVVAVLAGRLRSGAPRPGAVGVLVSLVVAAGLVWQAARALT